MVSFVDVNEENWIDIANLSVNEDQKAYLSSPIGILARGYVYRHCNARVIGISDGQQMIGVALVRDFTEEPVGYDLQQFMIDKRFQNQGYGTAALMGILESLKNDGRYPSVEVCVNREDAPALHVYEKAGFVDSGYVDEDLPNCINLIYHFR
ncbi:MAG: GNAT family N-acetyltransferase [Faecousia sp.]